MRASVTAIFLIALIVLNGCKNTTDLSDNGVPATLRIAMFGGENMKLTKDMNEPIRNYLSKKLGLPVEMIYTTDYTAAIEALKSKKVDMAYLSSFAYVIAKRNVQITPIVLLGAEGKPSMYFSNIITGGHSGINSMADVKARSKNLTLCFVDPASASGHLIPRAYLTSIGLNPDTAFKQTMFAGGHLASVYSVRSGKVDIGCTTKIALDVMLARGMLKKDDVKILWTSDAIVSEPVVVRADINQDFTKRVQNAYLDMGRDAPDVLHNYLKVFVKDYKNVSFMAAQDSFYNGIRKIAGGTKDLKLAN